MSDDSPLDADFLAILQCPACGGSLRAEKDRLVCRQEDCALAFPVENGIPHLLISEATPTRSD